MAARSDIHDSNPFRDERSQKIIRLRTKLNEHSIRRILGIGRGIVDCRRQRNKYAKRLYALREKGKRTKGGQGGYEK